MATIDNLDIQIAASAEQANKAIRHLTRSLGALSTALKIDTSGLEKIGKSLNLSGIVNSAKNIQSQTQKVSKSLSQIMEQYKDLGKGFEIKGSTQQIQKQIDSLTNKLENAKLAKDDFEASGKTNLGGYETAVKNVIKYTNQIESLKKQIEGLQTAQLKLDSNITGAENSTKFLIEYKKQLMDFKNDMKSMSNTYEGLSNVPKGKLDTPIQNLKKFIEELKQSYPQATNVISAFEKELQKLVGIAAGLTKEPMAVKVDTSGLDKAKNTIQEKISSLEKIFKDVGTNFEFEGNSEQLETEINKLNSELEKLYAKRDRKIDLGEIDTKPFRDVIYDIQVVRNKLDILEKSRPDALNRTLEETRKKTKDSEVALEQMSAKLKKLVIPPIREENLKKLQSMLRKVEEELERLKAELKNGLNMGTIKQSTDDKGFQNLSAKIAIAEKRAENLRKKIQDINKEKPKVSGWQKLTEIATLIDKSFSAIKRGVSSALNSIKKLGRGFQNLGSIVKKLSSAIGKMFNGIIQLAGRATSAVASSVKGMTSTFSKLRSESSGIQRASSGFSGLVKAAGGLLAAKGIVDFGKEAIKLGSDITEVENVVDTAFGSMAEKVYDFASTAKEQFGLSEFSAKQYAGTMMAMLKSSGVAQGAASDMSIALAGLAGDIASFYNIDTDTAFQKLRAGMSGETEPLKQLGINMNIVNLEAYAMSQGITKAYKDMTLAEQSILRYNYILAKTADAQGDFARTAGTWANQLRLLRLNIQSISAIIGQGLIAALLPAIKLLNKFMAKLTEVAKKFRDFMYVLFGKKIEAPARGVVDDMAGMVDYNTDLSSIGNSAEDVADGMDDASDSMDSAKDSAKKLEKALSVLGFDELHQLNADLKDLDTSKVNGDKGKDKDLGLDDLGIGNMDNMFDDLYDKQEIEPVNEWAKRLREAFLNHDWKGLGKTIAEMVNIGLKKIYDAIKAITPKVEKALRAFAETFNSFVNWLDWDLLGRTIGAGVNLLANSFNALFGSGGINLEKLGNKLSVGFRGLVDEIDWKGLGNALGNAFMIPWRIASGFVEDMWRIDPDTLTTGWAETGIALAEEIHGIFERINFAQIGKTLADGFNGITEIIRNFRNQMADNGTWSIIAENISNGLNNLFEIDLAGFAQQASGLVLDILYMLNDAAEKTNWSDFGYKIAEALFSVPWLTLFNQVFDFISSTFGEAMGGFVNYLTTHAEQLGGSFADMFNTIFAKIQYISSNMPWDDIGKGISTFLNASIAKIEPVEAAKSLGNFVTKLLGTMLQVAQETNWNDLGVKIGEFLTNIPWAANIGQVFDTITTIFGGLITGLGGTIIKKMTEIGTALADGFNHAFQKLDEFLSGISWVDIGLYISTGLNNMIHGIDWETAGETFGTLVKGLVDTIFVVAMNTDWVAFGQGIGDFIDGIPWLEILTEVALGLSEIIGEVLAGLFTTTSGFVVEGIGLVILAAKGAGLANSALEIVNEFAKNFGLLPEGVTSVVPVLSEKIKTIAGEGGLLSKISSKAKDVAVLAGNHLGTIGSVVFSPTGALIAGIAIGVALIVTHWDEIKEAAGKVKDWVSEKFGQLKESVSESMKNIGEGVKEGWRTAQDKFEEFDDFLTNVFNHDWTQNFGALGEVFNGFSENVSNVWDAIKRIFGGIIDFVAGVFTGDWSRAWEGVKNIFGGIWNGLEAVVKAPVNAIIGIMNALIEAVAFAVNSVGKILNGLNIDVPDWVPIIGGKKLSFNFPKWTPGKFPYLEQGGILKRGQVGFLEGNGAEAVVPLEKNRQWISRVSEEMARSNQTYYGGGIDEHMIANAVAEGVAMALMNNIDNLSQGNQQPIYITVKTESDEVLARAVSRGQKSLDYRMNPTPQYGY